MLSRTLIDIWQINGSLPPGITLVQADDFEQWLLDIRVLDDNPLYKDQTFRLKFKFSNSYPIGACYSSTSYANISLNSVVVIFKYNIFSAPLPLLHLPAGLTQLQSLPKLLSSNVPIHPALFPCTHTSILTA